MAEKAQNPRSVIRSPFETTLQTIAAAEAARRQSENLNLTSRDVFAGQGSGIATAAAIFRENEKTIREAQSIVKAMQATQAAKVASAIRDARASWTAATSRQRLLGPPPKMLAELAENKRIVEQSGIFGAVAAAQRQGFLDDARRIADEHRARVAAFAPRANPQPGLLQSLAEQTAKARILATRIERAGRTPMVFERTGFVPSIAGYGRVSAARALTRERTFRPVPTIHETLERTARLYRAVERVAARLEESALWYVLSQMNMGDLYLFSELGHTQAEAVVLDVLEAIVVEGKFVTAFDAIIEKAPYLTPVQRHHLRHALGHAGQGDFLDAVPPLLLGLEGAFASAARGTGIIDENRSLVSRPTKRVEGAGSIVKAMGLDAEFRTFLKRDVFGHLGNAFRHGDGEDARRQTLLAIVALAGWTDVYMGASVRRAIVTLMSDRLPEAVSQQRQLVA